MSVWYLDASAAVKLVVAERESFALRELVRRADRVLASVVLLAEVGAFARRTGADADALARRFEGVCDLVTVTSDVARSAATLPSPAPVDDRIVLRALDAIHVATALVYLEALDGLLTYDDRQAAAARACGITVHTPGAD